VFQQGFIRSVDSQTAQTLLRISSIKINYNSFIQNSVLNCLQTNVASKWRPK
jgi:hypothetical protein